jgi:putative salt-induced outer membrane protein YdiY
MKLFRKVIAITLLLISFVYNQVNTEAIRGNNLLPGIHHNLELDFAYISGNTEILNLNGSYRADYVSNSNWHGFFVWKYDRAFKKKPKEDFTYKGFGHLRATKPIKSHIYFEGFAQKEFNHFIDLENRELAGGGFRVNPFNQLYLGLGIMNETEKY